MAGRQSNTVQGGGGGRRRSPTEICTLADHRERARGEFAREQRLKKIVKMICCVDTPPLCPAIVCIGAGWRTKNHFIFLCRARGDHPKEKTLAPRLPLIGTRLI
jgi:hypothetical protein